MTGAPHLVVVGAGISGAAVAWFASGSYRVTVLDGASRVGGKLRTVDLAGIPVDVGAESMLARRPEATDLVESIGLEDRLRYPATTSAGLWSRGTVRPMPPGTLMGIPTDLDALASSGVVSADGVARARRDLEEPARWDAAEDLAIGRVAADRLGEEVVQRLIEPMLGGVYAGRAERLSLAATIPQLADYAARPGSLIEAARAVLDRGRSRSAASGGSAPGAVFAGLDGGVGTLPESLFAAARSAGVVVRTSAMVRELSRTETGWRLTVGPTRSPETVTADAVVLACPATPASRLLAEVAPAAAAELAGIEYASMATVALAFQRERVGDRFIGSGFLVPPVENRLIKAATFATNKWGWSADRAREADDLVVVRCSIGRLGETAVLQRPDEELISGAVADLSAATGLPADIEPVDAVVTRWGGGLPQYAVGHAGRIDRIRTSVGKLPGLALAGAYADGVGIAACVASARTAVDAIDQGRPGSDDR